MTGISSTLVALLLASAPSGPAAPPGCPVVVRWDAVTGARTLLRHGREVPLRDPTLRTSAPWCLEVRGISTGLQEVTLEESSYDASGLAGVDVLVEKLTPVVPSVAREALPKVVAVLKERVGALAKLRGEEEQLRLALQGAVHETEELVRAHGGLATSRALALIALDRMASRPAASESIAAELREDLGDRIVCEPGSTPCRIALKARLSLPETYRNVERSVRRLEASPAAVSEQDQALLATAHELLAEYPEITKAARETERLVAIAVEARSSQVFGPLHPRTGKGLVVRAAVGPRADPEISSLAPRTSGTIEVRAERDNPFRLSVAPVGLWVFGPRTKHYGTHGGVVSVTGTTDVSLQFGVAVSLISLPVAPRHGVYLQLPDLVAVVAGSAAVSGGVGASLVWGPVKLGLTALWLQEDRLRGSRLGDAVATGDSVRVDHSYPVTPRLAITFGGNL